MVQGYGPGYFANSRQRKKVMSKLNRNKLTQNRSTNISLHDLWDTHEHKNVIFAAKVNCFNSHSGSMVHQLDKIKKIVINPSDNLMISNQNFYRYIEKKTILLISSSIIGVPISNSVSNAAYDSIIDSYRVYNENKNIDDAFFVGLESFVNNYARNSAINYLQKHMQKKTDDDIFKEVLEGTILLSSLILEI